MVYVFGEYELDTALFELRRGGMPCSIEPQVFDLILFLVEHRDRLVTKQEILDAVWPDRFVSETTLSSRLKSARRVLGDTGRKQTVIRTMHGRGFRFAAPVVERPDEGAPAREASSADSSLAAPAVDGPVTRYARSGLVNIAYQVVGTGPIDIVFVMGWVSHLEMFWTEPSFARFLGRLASFGRLILFDKRGTGLSDRVPLDQLPTLEQRMDDVRAVMDAVGSRRAVLVGVSEGAPLCVLFGATYPERTTGLVLIGGYARRLAAPDFPWGDPPEARAALIERISEIWGGPVGLEVRAPSRAGDPGFRQWWATYLRMGASPAAVVALMRMNDQIDVRDILPAIRVPTLVIHREGERTLDVEHGRYLARHIPGAEYAELAGDDHLPFVGNQDDVLEPIGRFVSHLDTEQAAQKSLATVLVLRGRDLHDRVSLFASIGALFGATLRQTGAGEIVATLDHPARAIRFAIAVIDSRSRVSAALHTGECDLRERSVTGPAFEMAIAIASLVPSGAVWISSTVHDLVAGSGLSFQPAGHSVATDAMGSREVFTLLR